MHTKFRRDLVEARKVGATITNRLNLVQAEVDTVEQELDSKIANNVNTKLDQTLTDLEALENNITGQSNLVLHFEARKARGTLEGINQPFTSTIQDLSDNDNDLKLYNFTGDTTDGYCQQPIISSLGNNITFNNLLGADGNFSTDTDADGTADNVQSANAEKFYNFGNVQMFTATAQNGELGFDLTATTGHILYAYAEVKAATASVNFVLGDGSESTMSNSGYDLYTYNSLSLSKTLASDSVTVRVRDTRTSAWDQIKVKNVHVFDLTAVFGSGSEPTKAQMDVIIKEALAKYGYINERTLKIAYMHFIATDGVDSFATVTNSNAFDFRAGDFAIAGVFITPSTLQGGCIISKSSDQYFSKAQFALYIAKNTTKGRLCLKLGRDVIQLTTNVDTIKPSTLYTYKIKRIDGVLKCELNGTLIYNESNNVVMESQPNTLIFAQSADITGLRSMSNFKGYTALLAVYGHGVVETTFDTWCTQVFADYIAPVTIPNIPKIVFDKLKVGISIGNSLRGWATAQDAYENLDPASELSKEVYYETKMGNPVITQAYVDMLKAKGFKTMRLPITYWNHMNTDYDIEAAWLARVKEVVDYVIDSNTYCIINLQDDAAPEGWLKANSTTMVATGVNFVKVWTQIANYFKNYDERLIFESFNEILSATNQWNGASYDSYSAANYFNQLFVDAVRATGGNNADRYLCVNTYAGSGVEEVISKYVLPKDTAQNKLIVQLHNYDTALDTYHQHFYNWYMMFVAKGIPVMLGEVGTSQVGNTLLTRTNHIKFITQIGRKYNIPCLWWDDGNYNGRVGGVANYSLLDRVDMSWVYPEIADTMVSSAIGEIDINNTLNLKPITQKTLTLYRQFGALGFAFTNPGCDMYRTADANYCMFRKIDVTKLKSRDVKLTCSTGALYLAEYDIYGKPIYTTATYASNNTTVTLNENTVYIQISCTWMNDTSTVGIVYKSEENLVYI